MLSHFNQLFSTEIFQEEPRRTHTADKKRLNFSRRSFRAR
jgi:hypothetical protein